MKPNFALILAYDGIELCQRAPGGWLSVGSVAFDRPDLDAAIDALLADARRLAPEGVATKLIVPESEVRYATVLAPGPTDEARRYQIEAEIEGLTPYRIADLAYDWTVEGDHAQVAIVARETLREAEEFAAERGFNPVAFVARPEGGQFLGEPFFGQAAAARSVLKPGDSVQPDAEALRVTGKAVVPVFTSAAAAAAKPAVSADAAPPPAAAPAAPAAPAASAARPAAPQRRVDIAPARPPAPPPAPASAQPPAPARPAADPAAPLIPPVAAEATRKVSDLVRRMGTRLRREQAEGAGQTVSSAATARAMPVPAVESQAEPAEAAVVAFSSRRAVGGGAPPSRAIPPGPPTGRSGRADPAGAPARPQAGPGGRLAILPKAGAAGSGIARLTERGRSAMQSALKSLSMKSRPEAAPAAALNRPATAPAALDPVDRRPRPVEQGLAGTRPPADPRDKATEAEALTLFGRRGQVQPQRSMAVPVLMVSGAVVALLVAVAVWALYLGGPAPTRVADTPAPAVADGSATTETAAIVPPAPVAPIEAPAPAAAAPVQPAPEAAPQVTAEATPAAPVETAPVQAAPVEPAPVETAPAAPAPVETAAAPEPEPAPTETDPAVLAERLALEALSETPAAEVIDRLAPADPGVAQPQPTSPAESLAQPAPEAELAPERPQVAATAPSGLLSLPGRLAAPQATEAVPLTSPPPPPPFDVAAAAAEAPAEAAAGATPEAPPPAAAALDEPEITVLERQPAVVPPRAPGRAEPVIPPDQPRADPALAAARPEPRSERVRALGEALRTAGPAEAAPAPAAEPAPAAPPAEAEPEPEPVQRLDQGSLDQPLTDVALAETPPPGGVSLSLLRPLRRPTDLVPDATEPPPSVEEPAEVVASSLLPAQRPRAFADRVEATLAAQARERERAQQAEEARRARVAAAAAAAATPAPAPQQQAAARRPAPGDDEEGDEAASAGPATPSSASVQESATQRRAIRPREANLIGVFGAPSSRRALVRMSDGRVVRLQVGDRFDGGQVSAIGDSELRYVSGGRDRVLRIASRG